MTQPLAATEGSRIQATDETGSAEFDHHVIDPRYDELFETSFTPACDGVEEVLADKDLAEEAVETALIRIGESWLHVPWTPEFVTTLAMVYALLNLVSTERTARWEELARQRRQGRSLSSAHDVHVDTEQWLDGYLDGRSPHQCKALDAAVDPLTRHDVATLLDVNSHQMPRTTARLWHKRITEVNQ